MVSTELIIRRRLPCGLFRLLALWIFLIVPLAISSTLTVTLAIAHAAHHAWTSGMQLLGDEDIVFQLAGACDEISNLDVCKGNALYAFFERSIFVHLNVLGLAIGTGNGELGFMDGLDFSGNELFAHIFAVELPASRGSLLDALGHLGRYNAH